VKINREIRAPKLRVIGDDGQQIGVITRDDALKMARDAGLDLVEISPNSVPPVAKIVDYGKFRYDQTKREKESKKAQHVIKVKEIKLKPNIDLHDLETKTNNAVKFFEKGHKVKLTLMFRGREMAHVQVGTKVMDDVIEKLSEHAVAESKPKLMGRTLTAILAPSAKKGKKPVESEE
jgi:translation initiation factor IF-3